MGRAVSEQKNHCVDYLQVWGIGEVAGGGVSSLEGTVLRGHVGGSLQRPELAPFCCPAHFSLQLCCFLKPSQSCRGQHFVHDNKMFVCFLLSSQSGIFL